jgi:hypothetical protein
MKHEGGLNPLSRAFHADELSTQAIKKNSIGKVIEEET